MKRLVVARRRSTHRVQPLRAHPQRERHERARVIPHLIALRAQPPRRGRPIEPLPRRRTRAPNRLQRSRRRARLARLHPSRLRVHRAHDPIERPARQNLLARPRAVRQQLARDAQRHARRRRVPLAARARVARVARRGQHPRSRRRRRRHRRPRAQHRVQDVRVRRPRRVDRPARLVASRVVVVAPLLAAAAVVVARRRVVPASRARVATPRRHRDARAPANDRASDAVRRDASARARMNASSPVVRSLLRSSARAPVTNEIIDVRVGGKATARSGCRDPAGALTTSMSFYFRARSSSPTRRVRRRAFIRSRAFTHSLTRPRRLFVSRRRTDATGPSVGFHIYSAIGGTIRSQCVYKDGTYAHVPCSMERRATRARRARRRLHSRARGTRAVRAGRGNARRDGAFVSRGVDRGVVGERRRLARDARDGGDARRDGAAPRDGDGGVRCATVPRRVRRWVRLGARRRGRHRGGVRAGEVSVDARSARDDDARRRVGDGLHGRGRARRIRERDAAGEGEVRYVRGGRAGGAQGDGVGSGGGGDVGERDAGAVGGGDGFVRRAARGRGRGAVVAVHGVATRARGRRDGRWGGGGRGRDAGVRRGSEER